MDLVVLIDDPNAKVDPGNFVESMAALLERVSQDPFLRTTVLIIQGTCILLAFGAMTKCANMVWL